MFQRGLFFAMLASFLFSVMDALVKMASQTLGIGEIIFVRSVIGIVTVLVIMHFRNYHFTRKDLPSLLLRGILGGISICLIFYAISGMPLGDVSILQQLSAFFVLLISVFYLHEPPPKYAFLPLILIVAGACLVLKPWGYSSYSFYACMAILSAFFGGIVFTTIHQLFVKGGHNSWEIVCYLFIFSTLIGAGLMAYDFHWPDSREWFLLIGVGISSLLAQVFMTEAYGTANQTLVGFIMYLTVFLNIIWGKLFFHEAIDILSLCGGVLIIGSSVYLTIHRRSRKQ